MKKKMPKNLSVFWYLIAIFVGGTLLLQFYENGSLFQSSGEVVRETEEISLTQFLAEYEEEKFSKIVVEGETKLRGFEEIVTEESAGGDQTFFRVREALKPAESSLDELGIAVGGAVPIEVDLDEPSVLMRILEIFGPFLLLLLLIFFFMRMSMKGGPMPFSMKAGKIASKSSVKTRFKDVAGMEEVKAELVELVDFLKNPQRYSSVGARHPKGVLLHGQPGSGKTLLARAVAGEASVPFFSVSGSEFMEMLVGMGAAKVRELFGKAKSAGKAIIFIDEIDAIGKRRGGGHTGGHQEQEQTLNQILTEMDGFDNSSTIVVIASTNRPDVLDPALLRSGRFDRKILVARPTLNERKEILGYYVSKKKLAKSVDIASIARRTSGLVGADLENVVNEAALKTARENRKELTVEDFEYALEKVLMGPEKKIKTLTEKEKKIIAFHELGHAITSHETEFSDPVEKISIVSRGQALGVTRMMPEEDTHLTSREKFLDELVVLLGGRAAEEVFFGESAVTTGASNDFERATRIAREMISKFGMDEELGLVNYDLDEDERFVARGFVSDATVKLIEEKMKNYLAEAFDRAKKIVKKNKKVLEEVAQVLLAREFLSGEERRKLLEDDGHRASELAKLG